MTSVTSANSSSPVGQLQSPTARLVGEGSRMARLRDLQNWSLWENDSK